MSNNTTNFTDPDSKTDIQTEIGTAEDKNILLSHERRIHRLKTARWTILGGVIAIGLLIFTHILFPSRTETVKEVVRDGVSIFATIVTLALGFIAGSNIE